MRRAVGASMLGSLLCFSVGTTALERSDYRRRSGDAEAEDALAVLRTHIEASYARDGKLCGSALFEDEVPFGSRYDIGYRPRSFTDALRAEREARTGFACLGLDFEHSPVVGLDAFAYESDGTRFVARAFRAYSLDPGGVLPRWELRGEVVEGRLVVDPSIHRLRGGGPTFPGHRPSAPRPDE